MSKFGKHFNAGARKLWTSLRHILDFKYAFCLSMKVVALVDGKINFQLYGQVIYKHEGRSSLSCTDLPILVPTKIFAGKLISSVRHFCEPNCASTLSFPVS